MKTFSAITYGFISCCALLLSNQAFAWSITDELENAKARAAAIDKMLDAQDRGDQQGKNDILKDYMASMNSIMKFTEIKYGSDVFGSESTYETSYDSLSLASGAQSLKELCQTVQSPFGVNKVLANVNSRFSFRNQGGYFNQGTCWWHSSLTRAAGFLAVYYPNLPKPDAKSAVKIIDQLIAMNGVVSIPGFKNWQSFSMAYSKVIQDKLDSWQKKETLNFGWLRGIKGSAKKNPRDMREQMDRAHFEMSLYGYPIYMMLQFSGPMAHAWLILDIQKTNSGYTLFVLDSNFSTIDKWEYRWNQPHFIYAGGTTFIPYITSKESADLRKLKDVTDKFCRQVR